MKETKVFLVDDDVLILVARQERYLRGLAAGVAALMEKPLDIPVFARNDV